MGWVLMSERELRRIEVQRAGRRTVTAMARALGIAGVRPRARWVPVMSGSVRRRRKAGRGKRRPDTTLCESGIAVEGPAGRPQTKDTPMAPSGP
ncbi:hypothetical protein SQ03_25860 [Methylobacterium platani JCM 14648]|uniref:Uncharacterized protein n=2 Tax=Methylobacterium platani TaxID=427683 RepID=A0A179S9C8_9HYPH|nr:hypothetical protein SQ03_25860 [Methylobacterium platani JCM 14648]OAS24370.1 hypothetical protein A5481_14320 [Methylobacterium platani]